VTARHAPLRWGRWLLAAGLLYSIYTIAFTWPLGIELNDHLRAATFIGRIDFNLHLWTLAWISHAVVTDPLHIFDANIFYPARLTLAGSDHLFGTLPVAGPVYWLTGNPVTTLNVVVLSSFPLAGLAAFVLVAAMTRSGWAGLLGGFIYAFVPWRTRQFVPVQTFTIHYLPLVLLAIHAYLRHGGGWTLAAGLFCLGLQLLTAYYVAYVALVALAVLLAVAVVREQPPHALRRWLTLGAGLALVACLVVVVAIPYALRKEAGVIPSHAGAVGTAFLTDWLARGLVDRMAPVYVGIAPLALALLGCLPHRRSGREIRTAAVLFLSMAVSGYVLCLGSPAEIGSVRIPLPYSWLAAAVPGFSSMRVALRFITLVALGIGGLAGLGIARIQRRLGTRTGLGSAVACALTALTMWEYRPVVWPMPLQAIETGTAVPETYRWLAVHGEGGAVVELPLGPRRGLASRYRESRAMYFSTYHWLPLLNGYTAYPPPTHQFVMDLARRLPDPVSLQALVNLVDVRWIMLHTKGLTPGDRAAWTTASGLSRRARFADAEVFEVMQKPGADWRQLLLDPSVDQTFAGVPTLPLAPAARRARIEEVTLPRRLVGQFPRRAVLRIVNLGRATWPGLALSPNGLVMLEARWSRTDGPPPKRRRAQRMRLHRDLPPGESLVLQFPLLPPAPGHYRLTFRLLQVPDDPFPESTAPPLVRSVEVLPARTRLPWDRQR
jgi:hypothetical protein